MADRPSSIQQQITSDVAGTMGPFGLRGRLWLLALAAVIVWGVWSYSKQLDQGLEVTAMRDYVSWGMYMANFVFFIGVSYAGTLVSAVLRVTNAQWRRPITRMAEVIAVVALIVGASMVIIDMGRPDRLHHALIYGRLQSPILWDVLGIGTYLVGSMLYLYVALIPDLAILAQHAGESRFDAFRARAYRWLSLGFRGTAHQMRRLNLALAAIAIIIIPVAISVHTVVSWVFAMTLRPGWHSTIFGPYFVLGAIYSGTAAIILAMALFRKAYHLEKYIPARCFRNLGKLLLALNLLYIYFTVCEYLTAWYGGLAPEMRLLRLLMGEGHHAPVFWCMAVAAMFLPAILLTIPVKRPIPLVVTASILVIIGMWLKRYLIVVPTMQTPLIPAEATIAYSPTWVEWSITIGALAWFVVLYMIFAKLFPIISIWEVAEPLERAQAQGVPDPTVSGDPWTRKLGGAVVVLAAGATVLCGAPAASAAQDNGTPLPQIALSSEVEDDEVYIIALVTVDGEPVEGVQVSFRVVRTFGLLQLGTEETWDDGTAAVEFPLGLPGNSKGELAVVVSLEPTGGYAAASARGMIPGGALVEMIDEPMPQALWSSRPLWPLVAVLAILLAGVWSTYAFVVGMLIKIAREDVST